MTRFLREVTRAFRARELNGDPWREVAEAMQRVRVVVGISALGVAWLLPNATTTQRLVFIGLVGGVYLPYGAIALSIAKKGHPASRIGIVASDMLILFTFQLVLPQTRFVAMLGYLCVITVYSAIGGLPAGAPLTVASVALTVVAQAVQPQPPRIDTYTFAMFAAAAGGLSFLLDRTGAQQRRALRDLDDSVVKLEEARRQLEEAQRLAHVGSWSWDIVANEVIWSSELCEIFGVSLDDIPRSRRSFYELIHPDDRDGSLEAILRCEDTGEPFQIQHRVVRPDGEIRWVDARGQAVRDQATRTTLMMFGTVQDITERKQLERLRREFVSGVSHDLRTPLTSIKGFAALLRVAGSDLSEDDRGDYALRIERNAHELESLIAQLLDYSRLEAGHTTLAPEVLVLGGVVRSSVEELEPVLAGHDVLISIDDQITVLADPDGLKRVLRNLIENAAKFAPRSTLIWVGAHNAGEEVVLSVRDEGPGIPQDQRERVFDAFYRVSQSAARGTGLGLAVAKRYVELQGGRIWIDSEPGRGTMMSFTLPRARPASGSRAA